MRLKLLAAGALAGLVAGCVVAEPAPPPPPVERVVVRTAPPAEIVEVVPAPRPGYVWARGYWQWNGGRHVWIAGHWEPERVGYHYVHPHWDRHGDDWHFSAGVWVHG
jgi:hypothetical protein